MMGINKNELKYILLSGAFGFIWFIFALPFLIKKYDGESVVFQFFAFTIGLFVFFFLFLKSMATRTSINLKSSVGLLTLFLALDTLMPEYHVALSGELIKGAAMGVASTDYFLGYIAQNSLHLTGIMIYLFAYLLAPLVLLIISAKALPNFVRHV